MFPHPVIDFVQIPLCLGLFQCRRRFILQNGLAFPPDLALPRQSLLIIPPQIPLVFHQGMTKHQIVQHRGVDRRRRRFQQKLGGVINRLVIRQRRHLPVINQNPTR